MAENLGWYDQNAQRSYPIADAATLADDAGVLLPPDLLVDLSLGFPGIANEGAMLAAITVTRTIATAAFARCNLDGGGIAGEIIAAVVVANPVPLQLYPLEASIPGARGWIVFGFAADRDGIATHRFTYPNQSLLLPRAAWAYPGSNVVSIAPPVSTARTGDVVFSSLGDLVIEPGDRLIEGITRRVIVFRLRTEGDAALLSKYTGPCGGRPESGTCGDPEPIERIAGVAPDCDGALRLRFDGCANPYQVVAGDDVCGIVLQCGVSIEDLCAQYEPRLADDFGNLPNQGDDYCTPESFAVPPVPPFPEPDPTTEPDESLPPPPLPYLETFDGSSSLPVDWLVREGAFSIFTGEDAPDQPGGAGNRVLESTNVSKRNLATWEGDDQTTLDRRIISTLRVLQGPLGAKHAAGVVTNYRVSQADPDIYVWWTVELDFDNFRARVAWWNGAQLVTLVDASIPALKIGDWYRITFDVNRGVGASQVLLTGTIEGVTDPLISAVLGPVATVNYKPSNGRLGVQSYASDARWGYFAVEELI